MAKATRVHLPGAPWAETPGNALDQGIAVIKVELEGPLDLSTGSSHAATINT